MHEIKKNNCTLGSWIVTVIWLTVLSISKPLLNTYIIYNTLNHRSEAFESDSLVIAGVSMTIIWF